MAPGLDNLKSLWGASTLRGQIFLPSNIFGRLGFVALNPPVACRHTEPHQVLEGYTLDDSLQQGGFPEGDNVFLYSPSPGLVAPFVHPPNQLIIFNVEKCCPEYATLPLPEPTWILHQGDGLDYWLPHRHQRVVLSDMV